MEIHQAKYQEGHCSALGISKSKTSARKYFRQGQLIPVPFCSTVSPPCSLCSLSQGTKGAQGHGDPLLPAATGAALPRFHMGIPPAYSVALALLRSWAQHPPESLRTRNHMFFCLLPLHPVGCLTKKCCLGFLVGNNWLLFWQERKREAFKTVLKD